MIFSLYPRVVVKVGDERWEYDRKTLMFTDMAEIERASGMSLGEWQSQLGRYSILAIAALVHALRKKAGLPSDFETMDFAIDDLDVTPLHEDGTEYTADEVAEDIGRRVKEAQDGVPTVAAESAAGQQTPAPETTPDTSPSSPKSSASGRGSGNTSRRKSSGTSKTTSTPG